MAYIYQITNTINGKIYIGKTESTIEERFKEHCKDAFSRNKEKRPLYAAMRKYGINNFQVELIEETDRPNEREIYWIEQKISFKNGYNATIGGDGRPYLDRDLIIKTYLEVQNIQKTSEICHCDSHSVHNILSSYHIPIITQQEVNKKQFGKIIKQYSKKGELLNIFPSVKDAAKSIKKPSAHISQCANGKRKSAYGFIWKFAE